MGKRRHNLVPKGTRRRLKRQIRKNEERTRGAANYRSKSNVPPFVIPETNTEVMDAFPITKTEETDEQTGQPYLQYQGLRYIQSPYLGGFQPNEIVRISNELRNGIENNHKATFTGPIQLYGKKIQIHVSSEGLVQKLN